MNRIKTLLIALLLSSWIPGISLATELPSYYPERLPPMSGTIGSINIKHGSITIRDMSWRISMNVKVHSLNTEFSSLHALRQGMKVSFKTDSVSGKAHITEIWVLPDDYSPSRLME